MQYIMIVKHLNPLAPGWAKNSNSIHKKPSIFLNTHMNSFTIYADTIHFEIKGIEINCPSKATSLWTQVIQVTFFGNLELKAEPD